MNGTNRGMTELGNATNGGVIKDTEFAADYTD
jgi:hypothetical protein